MAYELGSVTQKLESVRAEVHRVVVGMDDVLELVLVTTFAGRNSHAILEGVPGIGKTLLLTEFAKACDIEFKRISMKPDLLPQDVLGYEKFNPVTGESEFRHGSVFTNILLADELNRATPKTGSALLEIMQEQQVTTEHSGVFKLEDPFMVFATQNPIEQEGTYELAEAEEDRFLMRIPVIYPTHEEALRILDLPQEQAKVRKIITGRDIVQIRKLINEKVHIEPKLKSAMVRIVELTRPSSSELAKEYLQLGGSTRAPLALRNASRVLAALRGRDYVIPEDIMHLSYPVLCHRVVFRAGILPNQEEEILRNLLEQIHKSIFGVVSDE